MSTRDLSPETPSLFDAPLLAGTPDVLPQASEDKGTSQLAKDFVRWCFSLGGNFHNSPDLANLRFWAEKTKSKIDQTEERDILAIARPLFFKRIEQLTRKAEAPVD